jgi:hypothetical protein
MGLTSSSKNEVWYLVFSFAAHTLKGETDVDTAASPSMQHLDATARQAITAAIREDMEAAPHDVTESNHVVIAFHAHIVRAERPSA